MEQKAKGKGKNGQSHSENQFIWVTKKIDLDRIEHEVTETVALEVQIIPEHTPKIHAVLEL